MDVLRIAGEELERFQKNLTAELEISRTREIEQKRRTTVAADEMEAIKKEHASQIMKHELEQSRLQREARQLKDDVRVLEDDLRRERDTVSSLKVKHLYCLEIVY